MCTSPATAYLPVVNVSACSRSSATAIFAAPPPPLRRLDTELEAVRNDLAEAREYPQQTLGIDLMSFGHWPHDRMASSLRGQPLVTGVLELFTTERMAITRYHDAYLDALASEGRCETSGEPT
jgi:hypothetical protein